MRMFSDVADATLRKQVCTCPILKPRNLEFVECANACKGAHDGFQFVLSIFFSLCLDITVAHPFCSDLNVRMSYK